MLVIPIPEDSVVDTCLVLAMKTEHLRYDFNGVEYILEENDDEIGFNNLRGYLYHNNLPYYFQ